MYKIDSFKITGLTVEGFKCFAEKQSFGFGAMNSVTGHNGLGKSSIADAISYAIAGTHFFGGEHGLDRFYTIGGKNAAVELNIQIGDGVIHKLTRSRVNDVTSITYDGASIRQSDLSDMFGERDVFLSIFNPLYFIESLGDKGKNLLERCLPTVSHETVLAGLSENTRVALGDAQMNSPEALLERVRSGIRELENTIIYSEGQRDLLETQAREKGEELRLKRENLDVAMDSIVRLEAKRTQGLDLSAMKEKQTELYARHDELYRDIMSAQDTSEVDKAILAASMALEKRRGETYVSKFTQPLEGTKVVLAQLREQYNKEKSVHDSLAPGIQCPMCKQHITEQNIGGVKKSFADSIGVVLAKGRELSAQLSELESLDQKALATFEQFKSDDITKQEAELEESREKRVAILSGAEKDAEARRAELDQFKAEIQTLELGMENGNLTLEDIENLEKFKLDKERLETEIAVLLESETSPDAETKQCDIEAIKRAIVEKRTLETAVKFYIAERTRLLTAGFDTLQRVNIVLSEIVKTTGEVKDVFKFSYEGRPYKFLSLSEKIKAGLEVSELVKRLTGRNYPVFIDNGESVPVIDNIKPSGQVFAAQVVKGAPLKVDILDTQTKQAA